MIHEATLAAGMEEDARMKKHTTTAEAINLVKKIKPWRTVFTHFSCRYMKIAEVLPDHTEHKVLIAFDHLRFKLSHLDFAYKYVDILNQVFKEEEKEKDDKSQEELKEGKPNKK